MRLKIVFAPSSEGGYTVYVPSLPGCISEGNTKEEALFNIKEAIELYLESTKWNAVPGAVKYLLKVNKGTKTIFNKQVTAQQANCTGTCEFSLPIEALT